MYHYRVSIQSIHLLASQQEELIWKTGRPKKNGPIQPPFFLGPSHPRASLKQSLRESCVVQKLSCLGCTNKEKRSFPKTWLFKKAAIAKSSDPPKPLKSRNATPVTINSSQPTKHLQPKTTLIPPQKNKLRLVSQKLSKTQKLKRPPAPKKSDCQRPPVTTLLEGQVLVNEGLLRLLTWTWRNGEIFWSLTCSMSQDCGVGAV